MRTIGAIFLLTLRSLLRSRFLAAVSLLALAAVGLLPLVLRDDGTAAGRAQVLVRYTLAAVSFLLSVGTLGAAPGLVADELDARRLQQVLVKPVRFGQLWIGKWLGLVAVNAAVLAAAFLLSGALLYWSLRPSALDPAQAEEANRQVLVARAVVAPEEPVIPEAVAEAKAADMLRRAQIAPDTPHADAYRQALERLRLERQALPPGGRRTWTFPASLPAGRTATLRVRFLNASQQIVGSEADWTVAGPSGEPVFRERLVLKPHLPQEIVIPPPSAAVEGPVTVTCINHDPAAILFHQKEGVRLLVPAGSYGMNLFRTYWLVLFRLALLAAVGLAMGSLFSAPVAVLTSFFALVLFAFSGYIGWVAETGVFSQPHEHGGHVHEEEAQEAPSALEQALDAGLKAAYRGANVVLSPLRELDPMERVAAGERVPGTDVARGFMAMVVAGCGAMAALAIGLFGRREPG